MQHMLDWSAVHCTATKTKPLLKLRGIVMSADMPETAWVCLLKQQLLTAMLNNIEWPSLLQGKFCLCMPRSPTKSIPSQALQGLCWQCHCNGEYILTLHIKIRVVIPVGTAEKQPKNKRTVLAQDKKHDHAKKSGLVSRYA